MHVLVDGRVRAGYDMGDSGEVDQADAASCDVYFKRSYAEERIPVHLRPRVRPYGLNYAVYPDGFDRLDLLRQLRSPADWKTNVRNLTRLAGPSVQRIVPARLQSPTLSRMHAPPEFDAPPRVLFMTRVWDPDAPDCTTAAMREERRSINEVRRRCTELLRAELGPSFIGGITPTEFALRCYPALVCDPDAAVQGNYLRLMREVTVCVATTGLLGSNGSPSRRRWSRSASGSPFRAGFAPGCTTSSSRPRRNASSACCGWCATPISVTPSCRRTTTTTAPSSRPTSSWSGLSRRPWP
jgi:hypothetical protein